MRWLAVGIGVLLLAIGAWAALRPSGVTTVRAPNPVAVTFVSRYVNDDGRIADTGNGGVSHSEGQGYGLLLAEAAADRQAFDRILAWTELHLGVRDDGLFSWRWDPATNAITDPNNASDGEILIAWALLRAHDRWPSAGYRRRALGILDAIEATLLQDSSLGPVILPGAAGFEDADGVVVNLSYWVFPALERFAAEGRTVWREVAQTGYRLGDEGAFGAYGLAADWTRIAVDGEVAPAEGWPAEFGYNAVRVPLHLCWVHLAPAETAARQAQLERYARFWRAHPPAASDRWDLESDQAAGGPSPSAFTGVAALTAACVQDRDILPLPSIDPDEAYYSAALKGLVALAIQDAQTPSQK